MGRARERAGPPEENRPDVVGALAKATVDVSTVQRLTRAPLGYARPDQWGGYVPPHTDTYSKANGSPRRAALAYAAAGWPVFPCKPGSKEPATHHGFKDASTRRSMVEWWWQRIPEANIAIATGAPAVDVLDVDVKPDGTGFPAFNRLKRAGLLVGAVGLVRTPSGGLHVHFKGTGQTSSNIRRQLLDFKATGGYVLVPPSVVDGRAYEWIERRDVDPARLDWARVRALLDPPKPPPPRRGNGRGRRGFAALVAWVESQAPDSRNRNKALYWASRRAVAEGCTDLEPLVRAAVATGLSRVEAERTVRSAEARVGGAT
ncbi:MAG: bifunctional DNA primase/polymerase [Streptosporangiaceae bacterium]